MKKLLMKNWVQFLLVAAFFLLFWQIAYAWVGNELILASPVESLRALWKLFGQGAFWQSVAATFLRALIAFCISFVLALVFALVSYLYPIFGGIFAKIVAFLRSLPVLAVLLILLIWFGASKAPVAVSFLSLFPILYSGFSSGLAELDPSIAEMSRVYGVPLKRRVAKWYLPTLAPYALRESGAALSFALKLTVSAEVLANTYKSLGGLMQEARTYLDNSVLFALVIVTFLLATAAELAFGAAARAVERRVK